MDIAFDQYLPDTPNFEGPGDIEALNVIPASIGYRPFPSLAAVTNALGARCQGAFFARDNTGHGYIFAGDATKLYRTDATTTFSTFSDVSRLAGGAYATPTDGFWTFSQFYDDVIATNGVDPPQKFAVSSDTNFSALGGSPLVALYSSVTRDFLWLGNTATGINHVAWSGLGNDATWSQSQTTQADNQLLPDGGRVQGFVGGEFMLIFQEFAIRRANYAGPPQIFDFLRIAENLGCAIPGSICSFQNLAFCIDRTGFLMIANGQDITPIGEQRVDLSFWEDLNPLYLYRVTSAIDAINSMAVWAYPDNDCNASGDPNKLICYQWVVNKWSHCSVDAFEMVWGGSTQAAYTMETLDNLTTNLDTFNIPLDSSSLIGPAYRLLGGVTTSHTVGFFNGTNLAGRATTAEVELTPRRRTLLQSVMPIIDGGTPTVTIAYRNRINDAITSSSAVTQGADGRCWFDIDARYMRATVDIPAGSTWDHLQGLDDAEYQPSSWA